MSKLQEVIGGGQVENLPAGQDVIADPVIERVAAAIFAHMYPRALYTDPLFKGERDDCRLLAIQFKAMFAERWTLESCVEQLTDRSCELVYGDRLLNTSTRGQIKDYAESYIEDLSKLFGDVRAAASSRSWKYVPEDDDDSELEDLGPSKAAN